MIYKENALALLLTLLCAVSMAVSAQPVAVYDFEVLEQRPQPRENFVQGLEIHGDTLYVGTGQWGTSWLREYQFPDMALRRQHALPAHLFGEGITRLDDRIYQLTWRAGVGMVYDADTFEPLRKWTLNTEGWGLTNDGRSLIYSDGSPLLYYLDPQTLKRRRTLTVTLGGRPLPRLNELEWIDGEIWANVYQSNQLVRIDPDSGAVLGIVDLRGLLPDAERREDTDVLNGIAYDRTRKHIWVTGKRWPWLYRIALRPRVTQESQSR
jgi:glutamine cyclotransferase